MPEISVDTALPTAQAVVFPRLLGVLRGYAERDDFTLTVDLGVARAAMSVPVRLDLGEGRTTTFVPFALSARARTAWFPSFRGGVRSEEQSPLASRLLLIGDYRVPLGAFGSFVDRHVLRGAAERSLRGFVERLRADVLDEIRRSELDVRRREG